MKQDKRYSIRPEYCGYRSRRLVVRFCGEFIGQAKTHDEAREIMRDHGSARLRRDLAATLAIYARTDAAAARLGRIAWGN